MATRSYAIIGTGALGGYYGARLARAGFDVHFLAHSDYDHIRTHGLRVDSKDGDLSLPSPQVYGRAPELPACDVALVALKGTGNHLFAQLVPPALKPDGVALLMQNGFGAEEDLARAVGVRRVCGGLAFLCANKPAPGHIVHLDYGHVRLAEYAPEYRPAGISDRLRAIAADFTAAGVNTILEEDLLLARWKKLAWNIPFNGLSVVMHATTDALVSDPDLRALSLGLMAEVAHGAAVLGRTIGEDFLEENIRLTENMTPYRTSMMVDYELHRPMEVEVIYGSPWRAATRKGAILPQIETLYRQLRFLDARNLLAASGGA